MNAACQRCLERAVSGGAQLDLAQYNGLCYECYLARPPRGAPLRAFSSAAAAPPPHGAQNTNLPQNHTTQKRTDNGQQ